MQQIERYGVIALVFLLVTIVAVSFWGDNKSPGFWSKLMGRGDAKKTAAVEPGSSMLPPSTAAEHALQNPLPLTATPPPASDATANTLPFEQLPADPLAALTTTAGTSTPPAGLSLAPNSAQPFESVMHADPISGVAEEQFTTPYSNQGASNQAASTSRVAQKPASQPSVASSATSTYVVQKGDSLARIARAKLGSEQRWTEIQALNGGVNPKSLRVGMKLNLPGDAKGETSTPKSKAGASAPVKSPAKATSKPSGGTYIVKGGDSLTRIAERVLGNGQRWKEIVALNPGLDPNRLLVGKSLKMPAGENRALVATALPSRSTSEKPRVR